MADVNAIDTLVQPFPKEVEEGNVEYKLQLIDTLPERIQQLASQLKWRLSEGGGEAIYRIGVADDGTPQGLNQKDMEASLTTLKQVAQLANASLCKTRFGQGVVKCQQYAEVLIKEDGQDNSICTDIRIAVCGNVDAGKSSFVGVLTSGELDNGRGKARAQVFNHRHEIETGRTSSMGMEILGFDHEGRCINEEKAIRHNMGWEDIVEKAERVVSFIDLAGHEKYIKTTVAGMAGCVPDYCLVLIGANMGVSKMTKEHIGIALALCIPLVFVVTKIDMCPQNVLDQTLADLKSLLKLRGVKKMSLVVEKKTVQKDDGAVVEEDNVDKAINAVQNERVVPIFLVSNVTGEGLDLVRKFLQQVPPRIQWSLLKNKPFEMTIDHIYSVLGIGTVVCGTVMSGKISTNSTLLLGPDAQGKFSPVRIKSVQSKRVNLKEISAGMTAGVALKKIERDVLRKGMVLVSPDLKPQASLYFEAEILVLHHSTTIHVNYQPMVQCVAVKQTATLVHIFDKDLLRTGDKARVIFKFLKVPELIHEGMRLLFRENRCKGIGVVTRIAVLEEEIKVLRGDDVSTSKKMKK
jgi:GTPase